MFSSRIFRAALAVLGLGLLGSLGLAFIYSGIYPIAADRPHIAFVRWALTTMQENSVRRYSAGIEPPPLQDPALVQRGLAIYREECLVCHGAPGIERPVTGRGLNPNPPRLAVEVVDWDDSELFWIIKHGLKMAGMPAFGVPYSDLDLWAVTAFVRLMPETTVDEYQRMVAATEGLLDPGLVEWVRREDPGFAALIERGDADTGRALLREFGCGACHTIPGVRNAHGRTGPPLLQWAERHFIAGNLLNTPDQLVSWITSPQAVEPGTAMPDLGVSTEQALHIAAYLFTLGKEPLRIRNLRGRGN